MYALQLASGQSLSIPAGGNVANSYIYTGPALVILTVDQYSSLTRPELEGIINRTNRFTVTTITLPSATGVFVQGCFNYLGYSVAASAASTFTFTDLNGGGSIVQGSAAVPQMIETVALAAGASESTWYGGVGNSGGAAVRSAVGGIPISDGPQGGLSLSAFTGTFDGIIRICGW